MTQTTIFDEIFVDNFAGGGGASTGIELATGQPISIAINHDESAIPVISEALTRANLPECPAKRSDSMKDLHSRMA